MVDKKEPQSSHLSKSFQLTGKILSILTGIIGTVEYGWLFIYKAFYRSIIYNTIQFHPKQLVLGIVMLMIIWVIVGFSFKQTYFGAFLMLLYTLFLASLLLISINTSNDYASYVIELINRHEAGPLFYRQIPFPIADLSQIVLGAGTALFYYMAWKIREPYNMTRLVNYCVLIGSIILFVLSLLIQGFWGYYILLFGIVISFFLSIFHWR